MFPSTLEAIFTPPEAVLETQINAQCSHIIILRACLHGDGGPQVGEVTRLAVVEKWPAFTCKLTTAGPRGDVTRHCCVVGRHVNRENGGRTTHFGGQYSFPLITLYLLSLQHFSAVAFYCHF